MKKEKERGRSKIDGTGCNPVNNGERRNLSQRARSGELIVEKGSICPNCGHHKRFIGNMGKAPDYKGQNIIKCTKCKHYLK